MGDVLRIGQCLVWVNYVFKQEIVMQTTSNTQYVFKSKQYTNICF